MHVSGKLITTTLIVGAVCQMVGGQYYYGNNDASCGNYNPASTLVSSGAQQQTYYNNQPSCLPQSQMTYDYYQNQPAADCSSSSYTPNQPDLYVQEYRNKHSPPTSYSAFDSNYGRAMVDPGSYNAQKGFNIREEKLNFGAIRKPMESETGENVQNVPEDGLYVFRNQIMEFRPSYRKPSYDKEGDVSYFDGREDCSCDRDDRPRYSTYRDAGYVSEGPQFQQGAPASQIQAPPCQYSSNPAECYQGNDDFDCSRGAGNSMWRFSPRHGNYD